MKSTTWFGVQTDLLHQWLKKNPALPDPLRRQQSVNNLIVVVTMTGKGDNPKAYGNNFSTALFEGSKKLFTFNQFQTFQKSTRKEHPTPKAWPKVPDNWKRRSSIRANFRASSSLILTASRKWGDLKPSDSWRSDLPGKSIVLPFS